jgi:hypothetical protein
MLEGTVLLIFHNHQVNKEIFFFLIIKFFQDYSLVTFIFLGDVFFWIMFFVAIATRGSLHIYKNKNCLVKLFVSKIGFTRMDYRCTLPR